MDGCIYLITEKGDLIEMNKHIYDEEDVLQALLERYPGLLAGDQIDPDNPRKWLLISRELGVPSSESGSDRWALDHLFVDQDSIPTLVEVKRSSDTRIRREVVGQMLEYAANAVAYWPIEKIKEKINKACEKEGINEEDKLRSCFGEDLDSNHFWQEFETNLKVGKVRLVFVADYIPNELKNIVEFLNRQMHSAEVIAVEIPQYVGEGVKTLVPRVHGITSEVLLKKSKTRRKKWDEKSFMEALNSEVSEFVKDLYYWALEKADEVDFGTGWARGSFTFRYRSSAGNMFTIFNIFTDGDIWLLAWPDHFKGREHILDKFKKMIKETKSEHLIRKVNGDPAVLNVNVLNIDHIAKFKESVEKLGQLIHSDPNQECLE